MKEQGVPVFCGTGRHGDIATSDHERDSFIDKVGRINLYSLHQ